MPSPLVQQVLVVQAQNGVNMASGTATTAPSTATTAPSTAPLPLADISQLHLVGNRVKTVLATLPLVAGPSTMESLIPIGAQLRAQDTPSIDQGARLAISTEQTVQSTQRYGTLLYFRIRHPCCLRHGMLSCLLC